MLLNCIFKRPKRPSLTVQNRTFRLLKFSFFTFKAYIPTSNAFLFFLDKAIKMIQNHMLGLKRKRVNGFFLTAIQRAFDGVHHKYGSDKIFVRFLLLASAQQGVILVKFRLETNL